MTISSLDRRRFIWLTSSVCLSTIAFSSIGGCVYPFAWNAPSSYPDEAGQATVLQLEGVASVNGRPISQNITIASGSEIHVSKGWLRVALPDGSVIELNRQATMRMELDSQSGGTLTLTQGAVLSVFRNTRSKPYRIKTANIQIGVRGTVCFIQILGEDDYLDRRVPREAGSYFCICNGQMDYLTADLNLLQSHAAQHHRASFLIPNQDSVSLRNAGFLLNHSDSQIESLIDAMPGKKHNKRWLFPQQSTY